MENSKNINQGELSNESLEQDVNESYIPTKDISDNVYEVSEDESYLVIENDLNDAYEVELVDEDIKEQSLKFKEIRAKRLSA